MRWPQCIFLRLSNIPVSLEPLPHIPCTTLTANAPLERESALEEIRTLVEKWNVKEEELSDVSAEVLRQRALKRRIVLHQLRQLVGYWNITERELKGGVKGRVTRVTSGPVKYRHPVSGQTWCGEGPQPEWLKTALVKEGYRVEELRVEPVCELSSVAGSLGTSAGPRPVQDAEQERRRTR